MTFWQGLKFIGVPMFTVFSPCLVGGVVGYFSGSQTGGLIIGVGYLTLLIVAVKELREPPGYWW